MDNDLGDQHHLGNGVLGYGGMGGLLCRLVPGIRSLISIPAGIEGVSLVPFLLFTAIGVGLWTALLAYTG